MVIFLEVEEYNFHPVFATFTNVPPKSRTIYPRTSETYVTYRRKAVIGTPGDNFSV